MYFVGGEGLSDIFALLFMLEIWQETTGKLVHWDNPAASAGMLSGVLALLLSICYYSLVSVLAYISLGLLAAIMAIKVYSTVMVFMKKVREFHSSLRY